MEGAMDIIKNQRRGTMKGLSGETGLYADYWNTGKWTVNPDKVGYNPDSEVSINVNPSIFVIPMPTEDSEYNPHLLEAPVHVDVRETYSY